eukprot:UN00084
MNNDITARPNIQLLPTQQGHRVSEHFASTKIYQPDQDQKNCIINVENTTLIKVNAEKSSSDIFIRICTNIVTRGFSQTNTINQDSSKRNNHWLLS